MPVRGGGGGRVLLVVRDGAGKWACGRAASGARPDGDVLAIRTQGQGRLFAPRVYVAPHLHVCMWRRICMCVCGAASACVYVAPHLHVCACAAAQPPRAPHGWQVWLMSERSGMKPFGVAAALGLDVSLVQATLTPRSVDAPLPEPLASAAARGSNPRLLTTAAAWPTASQGLLLGCRRCVAAAGLAAAAWLLPAAPARSQQLSTDSLHPRFEPAAVD